MTSSPSGLPCSSAAARRCWRSWTHDPELAIPDLDGDLRSTFPRSSGRDAYTILFTALLAPPGACRPGRPPAPVRRQRRRVHRRLAGRRCRPQLRPPARRGQPAAAGAASAPHVARAALGDTAPEKRPAATGLAGVGLDRRDRRARARGIIVDAIGWRALFLINVPLGVALVWTTLRLPPVAATRGRAPDVFGGALLAAGGSPRSCSPSPRPTPGAGATRARSRRSRAAARPRPRADPRGPRSGAGDRDLALAQSDLRDRQPRLAAVRRRPVRDAAARRCS